MGTGKIDAQEYTKKKKFVTMNYYFFYSSHFYLLMYVQLTSQPKWLTNGADLREA